MLRPNHEILSTPFPVEISLTDTKVPDNFKLFEPGIADTIGTFRIFQSRFSEPGLVTSDHGFEEFPDAERILGGINMKGPQYAAVARHGAFVMWGFQGFASDFTPAGERLFLNAIAYAVKHKGQVVESLRRFAPRDGLADVLFVWRSFYEEDGNLKDAIERNFEGEAIPEDVLKDVAAARRWFDEIRPYLRRSESDDPMARYRVRVDTDCRRLGVGNSDIRLLDLLVERLTKDPNDALAIMLAERYVPSVAPKELGTWLTANRERLYFTETDGYVWRVRGGAARSEVLPVEGRFPGDPVRVEAKANEKELRLVISVRAGWHCYAPSHPERGMRLRVVEGSAFELAGEFAPKSDASGEVKGYAEVVIPLKRIAAGEAFAVDLTYTVCDVETCRPPKTLRIGHLRAEER